MPFARRLLVDTHEDRYRYRLDGLAPGHRALHQVPGLVPTGVQQPGSTEDVTLFEHVDGQAFEEDGEARHRLGPGQTDAEHAVLGALDPRRPGVQVGQELTGVEVAPLAFFGMVVGREHHVALGAFPAGPPRMVDPHVDPFSFCGELDPAHLPRGLETQHVAVQLGVAHNDILPPTGRSGSEAPTENPEAPINLGFAWDLQDDLIRRLEEFATDVVPQIRRAEASEVH